LEYAAEVWDPHLQKNVELLEKDQHFSGFISFVYNYLANYLVSKLASVNSYAQTLVHVGLLILLCLVYRIALWKS